MDIRSLTRRNRVGKLYERAPSVEHQIGEALELKPSTLVERAKGSDHHAADYLRDESLVYFIREFHRQGRNGQVDDLSEILVQRMVRIATPHLSALGPELASQAFSDIVAELFPQIVNLDSDEGDYLQVRFQVAVSRLAISTFRHYLRFAKQEDVTVPLASLAGHELESTGDVQTSILLEDQPDPDISVEDAVVMRDELLHAQGALATIDEPYRTAFILRHYESWPIEHRDPAIPTLSRYFDRDPRTIRIWLNHAESVLAAWRESKQKTLKEQDRE